MTWMVTGENLAEADKIWSALSDEPWFTENYRDIPLMNSPTFYDHSALLSVRPRIRHTPFSDFDALPVRP
jgi:hypothetical protein